VICKNLLWLLYCARSQIALFCHCEERSDEAISLLGARRLLRFARNDSAAQKRRLCPCQVYQGYESTFEVKSLQTLSVKREGETYAGNFQCDASDSRTITLPNGEQVKTTCLLVGEFDILAVNLFAFRGQWDFAFALNRDLPRSTYSGYTLKQRKYLLATSMKITWPAQPPFVTDPFILLDRFVDKKAARYRALTKTKK
jgi:hypothetical protein